jgi:hypothetical protein
MVYNTQSHWFPGLYPSSGISKLLENTTFRKLVLFPYLSEWRQTPTLLGPLERANLNRWTGEVFPSPHLKTETYPISETLRFLVT